MMRLSALAAAHAAVGSLVSPSRMAAQDRASSEQALAFSDLSAPTTELRSGVRFYDLSRVGDIDDWLTPVESFFVLQHHEVPRLEGSSFRLVVDGLFDRPAQLSLEQLRTRETVTITACIECAGNGGAGMHGLVGNATWTGIRLAPLLRDLGLRADTRDIVFFGAESASERLRGNEYPSRFARSLAPDDAMGDDVLLAFEMNGQPLTAEHGFPLRLIVPGWYGIAHVKWLTQIQAIPRRFMGWYMAKDYVTLQGRPVESATDAIEHRATAVGRTRLKSVLNRVARRRFENKDIETWIYGIAWGNTSPWRAAEIAIDDAPYREAQWWGPRSRHGWALFRSRWESPRPGPHRLVSRVSDAREIQPSADEASRFKATPWENNGQVERKIVLPPDTTG